MGKDQDAEILNKFVLDIIGELGVEFPKTYLKQMKEVIAFKLSLNDETDRGCALMAASFIEHRLGELLETYLVKDEAVTALLSSTGPLGSFSARIDMAYAVALISKAMRRDLHLLRKIRNDFAHTPKELSFKTRTVADRCRELTYAGHDRTKLEPRECFTRAMLAIDGSIYMTITSGRKLESMPDEDFEERKEMHQMLMSRINNKIK